MNAFTEIGQLVGNTPLLLLEDFAKKHGVCANIYAKLESYNPTGSVKDRVALKMIKDAEVRGIISPGDTLIEPTSGNTGIGLAALGVSMGYNVIITMPDTMSQERIKMIQAFGAQVVLTEGSKGMSGAIEKAKELLLTTDMSIDDISIAVGYYNTSSFRRKFKQETGVSPSQFRNSR